MPSAPIVLLAVALVLPATTQAGDWTAYRDPTEGAFMLEVPAGWQVVGGLKRRSANQPHPLLGVVSPDGLTKIVFGDPSAIAYSELTPSMRGLGFREGQPYTPRGEPELINSYRTGEQWSETLGNRELQQDGCRNIQVISHRSLPQIADGLIPPAGVEHRDTVGETYFRCVCNDILYVGYGFSETAGDYYYQGSQVIAGAWGDDTSVVLLTPQGMGGFAMAIANHMLQSMRWDPSWWQRQFHAAVAQADALYAQATHSISQQGQSWDQTVRGVQSYVNPDTGKMWEVPITGANNFAQDGAGHIIGLTGSQPPPGFTLMQKSAH
ncbi:MAG TPA: hypothetical protein VGL28_04525 [Steroidobacteraceae bacterium]|jgi:hypothetical protein